MHRSGTTWLGRALESGGKCSVLHEPLNFHSGIEGVPGWYPTAINIEEKYSQKAG